MKSHEREADDDDDTANDNDNEDEDEDEDQSSSEQSSQATTMSIEKRVPSSRQGCKRRVAGIPPSIGINKSSHHKEAKASGGSNSKGLTHTPYKDKGTPELVIGSTSTITQRVSIIIEAYEFYAQYPQFPYQFHSTSDVLHRLHVYRADEHGNKVGEPFLLTKADDLGKMFNNNSV